MENIFSPQFPVLLIGPPGTGKTARVTAHFDFAETLLVSTLCEEDIAGLPYRDGDYDYRTIPALFRRLSEADEAGKTTVLFLDELDKARRSVADTLLTLIQSRAVGRAALPPKTCIVAACNPPEWGGGDGISEAMLSRFACVEYLPDVGEWVRWASKNYKAAASRRIIQAVECGDIPIIDKAGEDLSRRITCPRTIAMALSAIERMGEHAAFVVGGLVTAGTASQMMMLATREESEVMQVSVAMARKSSLTKATTPIRV